MAWKQAEGGAGEMGGGLTPWAARRPACRLRKMLSSYHLARCGGGRPLLAVSTIGRAGMRHGRAAVRFAGQQAQLCRPAVPEGRLRSCIAAWLLLWQHAWPHGRAAALHNHAALAAGTASASKHDHLPPRHLVCTTPRACIGRLPGVPHPQAHLREAPAPQRSVDPQGAHLSGLLRFGHALLSVGACGAAGRGDGREAGGGAS